MSLNCDLRFTYIILNEKCFMVKEKLLLDFSSD